MWHTLEFAWFWFAIICHAGVYRWESSKQIYLGGFDSEQQAALVCPVNRYVLDNLTHACILLYVHCQPIVIKEFANNGHKHLRAVMGGWSYNYHIRCNRNPHTQFFSLTLFARMRGWWKPWFAVYYDAPLVLQQAYDAAACKFRGRGALTNFPLQNYTAQLDQLSQVRIIHTNATYCISFSSCSGIMDLLLANTHHILSSMAWGES